LTKNCIGTLTLSGTNYYTGNTTINAGILELAQSVPTLATNSTISIAGGAVLQLDQSAVTNRVAGLLTNGVVAGKGLYRSANSSGFITGPGYLQVLTGPNGPGIIAHSIRGNTLTLTWPAGQGWRLQMETNLASPGWVYLTDGSTSSTNITVDPTLPGEYFRLVFS
jgi:autotransporter-associated beta strand protein